MKIAFRKCAALIASSRFICSCYSVGTEGGIIIPTHTDAVSRFGGDSRRLAPWVTERRFVCNAWRRRYKLCSYCARGSHCYAGVILRSRRRAGFGDSTRFVRLHRRVALVRNPTQSRHVTRDITVQVAVFNMRVALASAVSQVDKLVRGFS